MAKTQHSKNFAKVKEFYDLGVWPEKRVRDAVVKGWITAEEFKEITGKDYAA
jgi:uncharacterized XkdX family phage protein